MNLAADPAHAETLARLGAALDRWLEREGDLSELPEAEQAERFWPGGEQPVTATPVLVRRGERVEIQSETPGASLGYTIDGGPWRLYTGPVEVEPGQSVEAVAVRYGWQESDASLLRVD
jgi:hypothetical protein